MAKRRRENTVYFVAWGQKACKISVYFMAGGSVVKTRRKHTMYFIARAQKTPEIAVYFMARIVWLRQGVQTHCIS